jgi:hypothetical protein
MKERKKKVILCKSIEAKHFLYFILLANQIKDEKHSTQMLLVIYLYPT